MPPHEPPSPAASATWAPLHDALREIEERYRANRVRVHPRNWPPGADEQRSILALLAHTAAAYLAGDEAEREQLRAFFAETDYLVRLASNQLLGRLRLRFQEQPDGMALALALACVAMIFPRPDFRDLFLSLGWLYRAAGSRKAVHAALAGAAGREPDGMLRFAATFEQTTFFAAQVAPHLSG